MPKASKVIKEAIEVLEPDGAWCQGAYHEAPKKDRPVAHCAIGGVRAVTHGVKIVENIIAGRPYLYIEEAPEPKEKYKKAYSKALKFLADEVRFSKDFPESLWRRLEEEYADSMRETGEAYLQAVNEGIVISFNDHADFGSKESVLALFRKAQERAELHGE